jgi:hypothetical protein
MRNISARERTNDTLSLPPIAVVKMNAVAFRNFIVD